MRSLIGCTYKCADAGRGQEMYGRFLHGVGGGSLRSSVAKRERERTVGHDEAAFDVMNGAHRRNFQGPACRRGLCDWKRRAGRMPFVPRAGKSGAKRTGAWRSQAFAVPIV